MSQTASARWIVILASVVAMAPLSIDLYLPSLPTLQSHFRTDAGTTQFTLSAYFFGLSVGQLVYGPLSDRYGRKPPLLWGLALYTLASLGCAFAPDIHSLIALRLLQSLGGAAGAVIIRAMVRDSFPPQQMAEILSKLVLVMGVAPIVAPLIGGQVLVHFGWQAIFLLLAIYGVLCAMAVASLPETLGQRSERLAFVPLLRAYGKMFAHRRFMAYALAGGLGLAGMFAFIAGSSFVFIKVYGVSAEHFGWFFGANALGLIIASQVNSWALKRMRAEQILRRTLTVNAVCGLLLVGVALSGVKSLWLMCIPLFIFISCLGFSFPNSTSAAMAPFGDRAGLASGLLGMFQFSLAAVASAAVGYFYDGTALPMTLVMAAGGLAALLVLRFGLPRHPTSTPNAS